MDEKVVPGVPLTWSIDDDDPPSPDTVRGLREAAARQPCGKTQALEYALKVSGESSRSGWMCGVPVGPDRNEFNWTTISPSEDLKWTSCYKDFECTRLQVPLDYSDPKAGDAAVALVRYPSPLSLNDEGYLGPILFNPGGPGGSGVEVVLDRAKQFRDILGEGFDIVGFDPRGIGFTTPALYASKTKGEQGLFLNDFLPTVNSSESALGSLYATAQNLGHLAETLAGDVAPHVSTPVVARDMLSITKAHGRDKLQYWGFSYGTILGATFAAMFPDNVGRVVIDGVVDSETYYSAQWSTNLLDTDAGLFGIYQACVDAGPLVCRIYEKTADEIHARVQKLLAQLRTTPVSFYNETSGAYGVVDYSLVTRVIFTTLYKPYNTGERLTSVLADLELGNAEPIFQISETKIAQGYITDDCVCPSVPYETVAHIGRENMLSIACSDAPPVEDDLPTLKGYFEKMAELSMFAETWWPRIGCSGWRIQAKEQFKAVRETATSHPLLLIGNTADPVTPLWAARKMSKFFKNSTVLTQNSGGHCSIAATSQCTFSAIRAYFQNGTLPEEGTVCDIQSTIFGDEVGVSGLANPDWELLRAARELQQNYFVPTI
ncbi:hypothetical protein EIP91_003427 [Steccherinum ochraceum]|uniref:AB hydrolase-1 domain-containing protein n=1 Tax=Steccherinum ochraceum TaxID=92696 RepID=A0A4R0RAH1_9APHY|nr:hypothetical protein EIP91_003427 [Steccherinum ochraceum]